VEGRGDVEKLISDNQLDFLVWMDLSPSEIASVVRLEERRFPQLLVQRQYPGVQCSAVLQDNEGGVNHMVASLSDEQLQSCVVISGEPDINPYDERLGAFATPIPDVSIRIPRRRFCRFPNCPSRDGRSKRCFVKCFRGGIPDVF